MEKWLGSKQYPYKRVCQANTTWSSTLHLQNDLQSLLSAFNTMLSSFSTEN